MGQNTIHLLQDVSVRMDKVDSSSIPFDVVFDCPLVNNTYYRNKLGKVNRKIEHLCIKVGGYTIHQFPNQ